MWWFGLRLASCLGGCVVSLRVLVDVVILDFLDLCCGVLGLP